MRDAIELYHKGMSAEALAQAVLAEYFDGKAPSFPIDPFKMIRDFGVVYQFMEFKDLEGIYILPDGEDDIPVIGIDFGRPITRQRYTVAHELCHHIKDHDSSICPISGKKNSIESFADAFASELLMPTQYLRAEAKKYATNGKVNRSDILKIAEHFGVSFESAVFSVAYKINMLDGEADAKIIKRENRKFKPEQKKIELGLDTENVILWEQVVNSYEYFWSIDNKYAWYIFKNDFIYHENRLERLNLDDDVVAEIIALDAPMKALTEEIDKLTVADVIKQAAIIHHRITVIHPFGDGNGRSSRALLNWTYRLKGLPPIYIKYPEKEEYYEGLNNIDKSQNYDKLFKVFMREVIRSSIQLNKVSVEENAIV